MKKGGKFEHKQFNIPVPRQREKSDNSNKIILTSFTIMFFAAVAIVFTQFTSISKSPEFPAPPAGGYLMQAFQPYLFAIAAIVIIAVLLIVYLVLRLRKK